MSAAPGPAEGQPGIGGDDGVDEGRAAGDTAGEGDTAAGSAVHMLRPSPYTPAFASRTASSLSRATVDGGERAEGLLVEGGQAGAGVRQDGRRVEVAVAGQRFASGQQAGPGGGGLLGLPLDRRPQIVAGERADLGVPRAGVAHTRLLGPGHERRGEGVRE